MSMRKNPLYTEKEKEKEKENSNHRRTVYLVNIIVLSLITLAAVSFSVFLLIRSRANVQELHRIYAELNLEEGEEKQLYTEEELKKSLNETKNSAAMTERNTILQQIQSSLESGDSTTGMLRKLFSNDIVVLSGGRYYFYPVISSVLKHNFSESDFALDDSGRLQYKGTNSRIQTRQGIDVSEKEGYIDWEKVAQDQISFAYICAGGGDMDGTAFRDAYFEHNLTGAEQAELRTGVYYTLSHAAPEECREQAKELVSWLQEMEEEGVKTSLPVAVWVLPVSTADDGNQDTEGQSKAEWTENTIAFCETLEDAGYTPVIYGNLVSFTMLLDMTQLEKYEKWITSSDSSLYFPYQFGCWQYTAGGQVQGISTDVHRDLIIKEGLSSQGQSSGDEEKKENKENVEEDSQ